MNQLQSIETAYREATSMFEQNEISRDEYINLLEGFEVERVATLNAEELHYKENLQTAITAAINIARTLA